MDKCVVRFDRFEVLDQKSDSAHADNDWLCLAWTINQHEFSKTIPLVGTHGSTALWTGDIIENIQELVECGQDDTVILVYTVVNLSAIDTEHQLDAATGFVQELSKKIARIYLEVAEEMLPLAGTFIPTLPALGKLIGHGAAHVIERFKGRADDIIDAIFDDVLEPLLEGILNELLEFLLGRPNCNGPILSGSFIYFPGPPHDAESRASVFESTQQNSSCGTPARTKLNVTFERWQQPELLPATPRDPAREATEVALRSFRLSAQKASADGFVGAFPNFYIARDGRQTVEGTIFIKPAAAEWRDIPIEDLGGPPLDNFGERMRATQSYAYRNGFAGGFPTFFHAEKMVFPPIIDLGGRGRGSGHRTTVCGTVLFRPGLAEWKDVPLGELGDTPLDDIGARFRAVADYASRHGYVGGFPNFFHAQTMIFDAEIGDISDPEHRSQSRPGVVCGIILLRGEAAEWRDVVTLVGPG